MSAPAATVGILGGSGFYELGDSSSQVEVETPWGAPSAPVTLAPFGGETVAFLPRHGVGHTIPPHRINVRANLWALRSLGVRRIVSPCAAGSLRADLHPGDFVVLDQLVDRTWGRADTYYDGPGLHHAVFADPYCAPVASAVVDAARAEGVTVHERGTVVVVNGPRFSTRAESRWFRSQGWDVVNMTQYPEAVLARELGICFCGVALVTDYDTGIGPEAAGDPVTIDDVFAVLASNVTRVRAVLERAVRALGSATAACACPGAGPGFATEGLSPTPRRP